MPVCHIIVLSVDEQLYIRGINRSALQVCQSLTRGRIEGVIRSNERGQGRDGCNRFSQGNLDFPKSSRGSLPSSN